MPHRLPGVALAAALLATPGCYSSHEPAAVRDGAVRCTRSSGELGPVLTASIAACGGAPAGMVFCWNVTVGPDGRTTSAMDGATGLPPALVRCVRDTIVGTCFPDDAGRSFTICPL